jgi:ribosomal protein S18 acetylase RimI-like enzyme
LAANAPVFRLARKGDHPACAQIYLHARRAAFHWDDRDYGLAEFSGSTYGETLWVATAAEGEVLAFASVREGPDYWFLHNLYVAPGRQRAGIGRGLLEFVLAEVGRPVELKTDRPNEIARRLYEAVGFRIVEEGASGSIPWVKMRLV